MNVLRIITQNCRDYRSTHEARQHWSSICHRKCCFVTIPDPDWPQGTSQANDRQQDNHIHCVLLHQT